MKEIYLYKKNQIGSNRINVGLSYPSTYYYGMSVLGFLSSYKEFDMNEQVAAQRIFLNSKALAFNPKQLDLLGFSCIFEYDILQILKILRKYGFNINANKRRSKSPLIFVAGPVVTTNPEPFADFFDFMVLGDGEGIANEITEIYIKNKNKTKKEILLALSKIEGIYVPSLYNVKYTDKTLKTFYPISDDIPTSINKRTSMSEECLFSPILSDKAFYPNTAFIELARGCPNECKFCTAHFQNQPVRYFNIKYIKKAIKKASKYAEKIVFIGAMIASHPDFDEICMYTEKLRQKKKFSVEFSSLSFDHESVFVPRLLDDKSISLSIECGSEALRMKMNKLLTNEKILKTINYYFKRGIEKFNLYFMVGVPFETENDIDKYIDFSVKLAQQFKDAKFNHIISTFIPKPSTPFECEKRLDNGTLKRYLEKIKIEFDKNNIDTVIPVIANDNFNALVSRGDRRLSKFIEHMFEKNIPLKNTLIEYRKFINEYNAKPENTEKLQHYSEILYKRKPASELLAWEFINF